MIKFEVKNRFTGCVQFIAEIDCEDSSNTPFKLGLAVKWAVTNKADLRGADLYGADLRGADLRGADLRGADLYGADLRGANLCVLQTNIWTCFIHKEHIRIGCQYYTVSDWLSFDDNKIAAMNERALAWWKQWKPAIVAAHIALTEEAQ